MPTDTSLMDALSAMVDRDSRPIILYLPECADEVTLAVAYVKDGKEGAGTMHFCPTRTGSPTRS